MSLFPTKLSLYTILILHLEIELLLILGGCPYEQDEMWNITWPATNALTTAKQKCPGSSEAQGITCTISYVSKSTYLILSNS